MKRLPVETSTKQVGAKSGWMSFFIEGSNFSSESALPCFEARVGLADDIDPATAAHDLAVRVTVFERLDRRDDFHGEKGRRMKFSGGLSTGFSVFAGVFKEKIMQVLSNSRGELASPCAVIHRTGVLPDFLLIEVADEQGLMLGPGG